MRPGSKFNRLAKPMTRSHDNARSGVNECQLGPTVSNDGNRLLGNKRRRAQRSVPRSRRRRSFARESARREERELSLLTAEPYFSYEL